MTRKEMNLAVFERKAVPHVFFQPRFEPWFALHRKNNNLPKQIEGMELREVYDLIGASMRTVDYYTGQPGPIVSRYTDEVETERSGDEKVRVLRFKTPHGTLEQKHRITTDHTWRMVEHPARKVGDLKALRWLLERRRVSFSVENFRLGAEYIGDRGQPQFWVPKSPYFALAQQWMKYEDFIYAVMDAPGEVEETLEAIDRSYDDLYRELADYAAKSRDDAAHRLTIVNFGENVAMAYLSPDYFVKYCMPWYNRRAGQLREAGLFTHIHIDGDFKPLLPYLKDLPFDGLEALTPEPQGDVTIEEIHANIGDKILLDGIPAISFMEHQPKKELEAQVKKIIELFHPRLVLGISDELPEGGDDETFDRLRWVSDLCRKTT